MIRRERIRGAGVYRLLLRAYPPSFRQAFGREMGQTFDALLAGAQRRGRAATAALWGRTIFDLVRTAVRERVYEMKLSVTKVQVAAGLLLVIPVLFLASQFLVSELGVPGLHNPFDVFYNRPGQAGVGYLMDALIFLGPLLAALLLVVPFYRDSVRLRPGGGVLVAVNLTTSGLVTFVLLVAAAGLAALFISYVVGENWACLIGAVSC